MQQQRPAERSTARHKPRIHVTTASAERKGVNLPGSGRQEHALRVAGTKQQSPPEREAEPCEPCASPPGAHAWGRSEPAPARGRAHTWPLLAPGPATDTQSSRLVPESGSERRRGLPGPGLSGAVPSRVACAPQRCAGEEGGTSRAATGRDGHWAWSCPRRGFRSSQGLLFVCLFGSFFLLAKQLSKAAGCRKAGTAAGAGGRRFPLGDQHAAHAMAGGNKRENSRVAKKIKKRKKRTKKEKKKKDINSLGNPRPQGRERVQGTTAHVTGDRQTDSPVPIRYVKYHHSGTLTDL